MKYAAAVFVLIVLACYGSPESFAADGRNISNVNGEVRATAGSTYDTISTVNGDVHLGQGVTAEEARTVNGEITVESEARVGTLKTVNGTLDIGEGVTVARDASTVNGEVHLARRAQVGGDVSTVSGEIEIQGAEVTGNLSTHNGDIELTDGARVRGGIHVKKNNNSDRGWGRDHPPRVSICSTCVVEGELRFDRPVELRVEQGAKIGAVIGEDVKRL